MTIRTPSSRGSMPNFAFPAPRFVYAAANGTPVDHAAVGARLKADDGLDPATSKTSAERLPCCRQNRR